MLVNNAIAYYYMSLHTVYDPAQITQSTTIANNDSFLH